MRRGLIGHDVDFYSATKKFGEDGRRVAEQSHAERPALALGGEDSRHGIVEVARPLVKVPVIDAALEPRRIDVHAQAHPVVHRDGERLRAAHAPRPPGQGQRPGEGAAKALLRHRGEGLVGSLEYPLGANVDPRPRSHLSVHREPQRLEAAELGPVGPVGNEVRVRDQHARCPLVGREDAHRTARLHEHRLVALQGLERAHQRVEAAPVACGTAGAAVDDQVVGSLGHLGVEVVLQHPKGALLGPPERR